MLTLISGNDFIYLFDSHSKDKQDNTSSSGTAVLLKLDTLNSLENHVRSVYYNTYPQILYFQVQFIKVNCTINAKKTIKNCTKKEQLSAKRKRSLIAEKGSIMKIQKRKYRQLKRDTKVREFIKQHEKEKYLKIPKIKKIYIYKT